MSYRGNIAEDAIIRFKFPTNDSTGASITYTGGTVKVRKDDDTAGTVNGVAVTKDFDGKVGSHHVQIDTSADAYYAVGADYFVSLDDATIDGKLVSAPLADFSIENRVVGADVTKWNGTDVANPDAGGYPVVTVKSGQGSGELDLSGGQVKADVISLEGQAILTDGSGVILAKNDGANTISSFDPFSDKVYLGDGAHGGAAASLALASYTNFLATGFSTHDATAVRTEIDANSTQLAAIVADTSELQSDNVPGLIAALNDFDPAADAVITDAASRSASQATGFAVAGDAMALTAAERTAVANAIMSLADGIETGATLKQALQRIAALVAGKVSGAGTGTESFLGLDGSTLRVTATVDTSGNRTEMVYDG